VKPWRVILNGTDITRKVSRAEVKLDAENICGETFVDIADKDVLAGIVLPRVPQSRLIVVDALVNGEWISKGSFFLEDITYPRDTNARTASVWGRTLSARLNKPWAQKISKQWPAATTFDAILQELAAMCGVTIVIENDYPVCQYCYAVSDWYPSQIVQDLAERSGQICWPQVDGSLLIAPRLYRDLPAPDVTLIAKQIDVQSVRRQVPDFGNRILVSGDASVAGLSVQVVPLVDDTECVAADGKSSVRLIAVVLGVDGIPVAESTVVTWSASSGILQANTSLTEEVIRQGEVQRAQSYKQLTLDLPALAVIGVYARKDVRRARNLYLERGGSVSGRTVTFALPLDFYDQALVIDYIVQGAPNTWTAGRIPGDVTVLASVAGAQGACTLHQSNPTACATQISLEASPSSPCLGQMVSILLKASMFGAAGIGSAAFGIQGCGNLTATQKLLTPRTVTETLRTSFWGGAAEVRLSAIPVAGTPITVVLTETPGGNLFAALQGQTAILSNPSILPGTQVTVTYTAGGTALIGWQPTSLPSGNEMVSEWLPVTHATIEGVVTAQVTLTRTPVAAPVCSPVSYLGDYYASHEGKVVSLIKTTTLNELLPIGHQVKCTYPATWLSQPGCNAIITVRVDDGSEDGGRAQIAVSARDCRTVNPGSTDPNEIPDDEPGGSGPGGPSDWEEPEEPIVSPTGCDAPSINGRTPTITADNHSEVFVSGGCPGLCTCDQLCASLRSTGRLSTEAGMTYSTCMAACAAARDAKCTPCTLTGPTTLNPGEEGTWDDGKGNSAEVAGGSALTFVRRTFEDGYTLRMPTGGQGPFTIRVCYGEEPESCCEAQVDFPPCSLSGLTTLAPGAESIYLPSAGMDGAVCTCGGDMEFVRLGAYGVGFVCRMKPGGCQGTVTVTYGGRVCGTLTVVNPMNDYVGSIAGPTVLAAGDTAIYYHDLGPGAKYTGNLPGTPFENDLGNGLIGTMSPTAPPNSVHIVSFSGPCNSKASKPVSTTLNCTHVFSCGGVSYCVGPMLYMTPDCVYRAKDPSKCAYTVVDTLCYVNGDILERWEMTYERSPWTCRSWFYYNCVFYPIIAVV
jgi:hypothetical protein